MIETVIQAALVAAAGTLATIILKKVRSLPEIDKFKAYAHILAPAAVMAAAMYSGGWVAIGFDRPVVIGQLKSEMTTGANASVKPGFVIIADPDAGHPGYVVEVAQLPSRVWSTLDATVADNNKRNVEFMGSGLHIRYPLTDVHEPLALVVEGEVGSNIIVDNRSEPVEEWKLSSRSQLALVVPVLFNCFVALGIGLVTGAPPISPNQNNTRKKRTKPNKK